MAINETLTAVGDGLGSLFDGIGQPLGTLLIIIGIAGGVIAIFWAVANSIRRSLGDYDDDYSEDAETEEESEPELVRPDRIQVKVSRPQGSSFTELKRKQWEARQK